MSEHQDKNTDLSVVSASTPSQASHLPAPSLNSPSAAPAASAADAAASAAAADAAEDSTSRLEVVAAQAQFAANAAAKAADVAQLAATRAAAAAALASTALEDYASSTQDGQSEGTDSSAAGRSGAGGSSLSLERTVERAATEEHGSLLEASSAAAASAELSQIPADEAVKAINEAVAAADAAAAASGGAAAAPAGAAGAPAAEHDSYAADFAICGLDYPPDKEPISFKPDHTLPFEEEESEEHLVLHGNPASRGIAVGRISFLQRSAAPSSKRQIDDVEAEIKRFEEARNEAIAQLGSLYEMTVEKLGDQNAVVFQIHQMMLDDPEYVDAIESTIREEKVNAEYAVDVTGQRFADMFSKMDNDYMQGRAADVQDVSHRLCDVLNQNAGVKSHHSLIKADEPIILATDDLSPSETVQLDQNLVRGILTSAGSARSHTVIFARTLGLPAVINIGHPLKEELEGKLAIVDGGAGIVIIEPDEKTLAIYAERKRTEDALRARLEQFRGKETRTLSGRRIQLFANIGAVSDLDLVKTSDAEGIGLFRSEYIYLSSSDFPSEETQFNIYKEALAAMDGKKVVIRTLDIGADKTADYFMLKPEENPAMGMRAVRICLSRPEIFKTQLRALYRASVYGTLAIMFPMISSVEEVKECLRICKEVQDELTNEGKPFSSQVELGIMIETPASAIISDLLAEYVDFFSIGTNDLTQFTLAVDRQNAEVGRFLNPYHRAVIRLIEMTVNNAHKNGIWVGVCGELAADEGFTHELVRIGVDEISVVPSSVLMLRARISTLG